MFKALQAEAKEKVKNERKRRNDDTPADESKPKKHNKSARTEDHSQEPGANVETMDTKKQKDKQQKPKTKSKGKN